LFSRIFCLLFQDPNRSDAITIPKKLGFVNPNAQEKLIPRQSRCEAHLRMLRVLTRCFSFS
jgi:hypothetical protein